MKKYYEIREAKTNEVLVDKLSSEDDKIKQTLAMFEAYQDYYGVDNVKLTHYEEEDKPLNILRTYENKAAREYKREYTLYVEELYIMGNL